MSGCLSTCSFPFGCFPFFFLSICSSLLFSSSLGILMGLLSCLSFFNSWVLWLSISFSLSSINNSFLLFLFFLDLGQVLLEWSQIWLWLVLIFDISNFLCNLCWSIDDFRNSVLNFLEGDYLLRLLLISILQALLEILDLLALLSLWLRVILGSFDGNIGNHLLKFWDNFLQFSFLLSLWLTSNFLFLF